jgi:Domain of unknown function (DUF4349)
MTSPEAAELEAVDDALAGRPVPPEHADLAELALLLRDERPEPAPTWATHLDRRAAAGFPARPRRRVWPRIRPWLHAGTLVPVVGISLIALMIALAAIVPQDSEDMGSSASSGSGEAESAMSQPESADSAASSAGGGDDAATRSGELRDSIQPMVAPPTGGGNPGSDARDTRFQERSAALTLAARPREIDRVASEVGRVAADLGGFVSSSSIASSRGGDIALRVPSNRLDAAIQRLSRLARVRDLSRQSLDITSTVVSARERLNDARTERRSLLRQLAQATTVNETESIRARLRIVSREIASARTRLRSVNNRARFANVEVALVASRAGDDEGGAWTPGDAFDDATRVLEVAAGVTVIAGAALLPLFIAAGLGWLARRGFARRRRERALDAA